jgi:uncharacterized RDD family membrane protein YckC
MDKFYEHALPIVEKILSNTSWFIYIGLIIITFALGNPPELVDLVAIYTGFVFLSLIIGFSFAYWVKDVTGQEVWKINICTTCLTRITCTTMCETRKRYHKDG